MRAKERNIAKLIKTNPKLFYQYVSSKTKPREQISNLKKPDGTLTENDLEKAEVLKTFSTVSLLIVRMMNYRFLIQEQINLCLF